MIIESKSLKETEKAAKVFVKKLLPRQSSATIVALHGDLGSGKTTFTHFLAKELGVKEKVTSPTFVIIKTYNLQLTTYNKLFHIDAYRLRNDEELRKLGWQEIISDPKNFVLIEWPERVADVIPKNAIKIGFEFIDENTRKIEIGSRFRN